MKPVDLARKLRREAAFKPAALDRGKETLMAVIQQDGVVHHALIEFGDSVIGIGTQGAHGAVSPQRGGIESQFLSVAVADVAAHYQRARAAGARIAREPRGRGAEAHAYEAFDPEGHRWRFVHQRLREVPRP